jgi:hypothetical protein
MVALNPALPHSRRKLAEDRAEGGSQPVRALGDSFFSNLLGDLRGRESPREHRRFDARSGSLTIPESTVQEVRVRSGQSG